ncbi:lamin tail domain-containing protein [Candidatus Fermentibacterales bacterium]|nr:lamin tail domain-containing protein [Candidatus Fermentibacterales bacterium]
MAHEAAARSQSVIAALALSLVSTGTARATAFLVITEVMSHPVEESSGEYVEVRNASQDPACAAGCALTDGDALDTIIAWDEEIHGQFPHPGVVLGCDTIPAGGIALVLELGYAACPAYDEIPEGTVILTTGDYSICNGLSASSDPLTLYDPEGTSLDNVLSTFGTPLESPLWQDRDDDGLDSIPFDPGEGLSLERISTPGPDIEANWAVPPTGRSPGWSGIEPPMLDLCLLGLTTEPAEPNPEELFSVAITVYNAGQLAVGSYSACLFRDDDLDSIAEPSEILGILDGFDLGPGCLDTLVFSTSLPEGSWLIAALCEAPGDTLQQNDIVTAHLDVGEASPIVISEVLCNPSGSEDTDELIELWFPGPGVFDLSGCGFTDGDALDLLEPWDPSIGTIEGDSLLPGPLVPSSSFVLILDREYASGSQPYSIPPGTVTVTVGNTTIGNGLSGNDPITLYSSSGTTSGDLLSTYGTPVLSDDPLLCDDDGLDGIPFDPGAGNSVQRVCLGGPDQEGNWLVFPDGPTPGAPPPLDGSGKDLGVLGLGLDPPFGKQQEAVLVSAVLCCLGTDSIPACSSSLLIYADEDADQQPDPEEALFQGPLPFSLGPLDTLVVRADWTSSSAGPLGVLCSTVTSGDSVSSNDAAGACWNPPSPVVVNELMYHPSPGSPEWIELLNVSGSSRDLSGWYLADSRDTTSLPSDSSLLLEPGCFAILCGSPEAFSEAWPGVGCPVIEPLEWLVLNDATQQGEAWADRITLMDPAQAASDYVPYDDAWGGGSGVSLERRSQEHPGYQPSSWGSCVEVSGGTPGSPNSILVSPEGQGELLDAFPDPFSPDGDGVDDVLTVQVIPGCDQSLVSVRVYNVQGRPVATLADRLACGPVAALQWDGRSDDGTALHIGRYVIHAWVEPTGSAGAACEALAVVVLARRL